MRIFPFAFVLIACGSSDSTALGPSVNDGGAPVVDPSRPRTVATVADGIESAQSVTVDATNVYVASQGATGHRELFAIPKAGGSPRKLAGFDGTVLPAGLGHRLATDGAFVYYVTRKSDADNVMRIPVGDGPPETVASNPSKSATESTIAILEGVLYFTSASRIYRVPAAGGTPEPLTDQGAAHGEIAVAGTNVCFLKTANSVAVVPTTGGTVKTLAELGNQDTVGADRGACYTSNGKIIRHPVDGSASQVLASDVGSVTGFLVDDAGLYWTSSKDGGSMNIIVGTGAAVKVLTDFAGGKDLASDATHIYFVSDKLSTVRRVER